jgi:hypothetical protein
VNLLPDLRGDGPGGVCPWDVRNRYPYLANRLDVRQAAALQKEMLDLRLIIRVFRETIDLRQRKGLQGQMRSDESEREPLCGEILEPLVRHHVRLDGVEYLKDHRGPLLVSYERPRSGSSGHRIQFDYSVVKNRL